MSALADGYALVAGADVDAAHAFLTDSYWAKGISRDKVERSLANSLVVSVQHDGKQVAMARVVSDLATFAYLADVYVLDDHRGQGLSKAMLRWLLSHPDLQDLRRWALFTKDAQSLYAQFGWREYPWPERMMVIDAEVFKGQ